MQKKQLKLAFKNYLGKPKMNKSRSIIHTVTSTGFKALRVPAVLVKPFTAGRNANVGLDSKRKCLESNPTPNICDVLCSLTMPSRSACGTLSTRIA